MWRWHAFISTSEVSWKQSVHDTAVSWQDTMLLAEEAMVKKKKKLSQITVVSILQYLPITFLVLMQLSSAALWDTGQHLLWHSIHILLALQLRNWSLWRINLEPNYCPPEMHEWTSAVWETGMPGQHYSETMHFKWLCDCLQSASHSPEKYVAIKHINTDNFHLSPLMVFGNLARSSQESCSCVSPA